MSRLSNDQEAGATQLYFLLVTFGSLRRPDNRKDRQTTQHWVLAARYGSKAGAFVNDGSRLTDAVAAVDRQ